MLLIVLKSRNEASGEWNELTLFAPHFFQVPELEDEEINFIQASGDELDIVVGCYFPQFKPSSIPVLGMEVVVRWYGITAKTIYSKLVEHSSQTPLVKR